MNLLKLNQLKLLWGGNNIRSIKYKGTCGLNVFNRAEGNLFFTKEEAQARCDELNQEKIYIDIDDIDIPQYIKESKPSIDKVQRKLNYYKTNHKFDKEIIIDENRVLQDGYIIYLLCKIFNIKTIKVVIQN